MSVIPKINTNFVIGKTHMTMIRNLNDVFITSDYFGNNIKLNNLLSRPFNIVFGNNGTGKSTISKAFSNSIQQLPDENGPIVNFADPLTDLEKSHVYVFNEKFIHDNIDIPKDGLEAIVMIGAAGTLAKDLEEISKEINNQTNETQKVRDKLFEITKEYEKTEQDLVSGLKKGGYLERSRSLSADGTNKRVILSTILQQANSTEVQTTPLSELLNNFNEGVIKYQQAKNGMPVIWSYNTQCDSEFKSAAELLNRRVEKPKLSDREKNLLELITQGYDIIRKTKELVIDSHADFCPLCQQDISHTHRETLTNSIESLESVLNEKSKEYETTLRNSLERLTYVKTLLPADSAFKKSTESIEILEGKINDAIKNLREAIESRLCNIYAEPISYDTDPVITLFRNYNEALASLNTEIQNYNNELSGKKKLLKELERLNCCIGCLENKSIIDRRSNLEGLKSDQEEIVRNHTTKLEELNDKLSFKKAEATQINIALNYINECLSFIFFSNDRLVLKVLETDDRKGIYALYTHGHRVSPENVSIGERNAIALAYYFAQTFNGLNENHRFSEESLFVIDDPVSSFDRSNRVGIISFLRQQFNYIFDNNQNSKVLLLTHDLHTANDMAVIAKELVDRRDKEFINTLNRFPYMELKDKTVEYTGHVNDSYRQTFQYLFNFASQDSITEDPSIGNQLRQLLEAYSNFNYGISIEYMLSSYDISALIPEEFREFYHRLALNLVINNESHSEHRIDALNTFNGTYQMSNIKALVQQMLLFIFFTNENHFRHMINGLKKSRNELSEILCSWEDKIPTISLPKKHERTRLTVALQQSIVEIDEDSFCHCGDVLLPQNAAEFVGQLVILSGIRPNTNFKSSNKYPNFSYFKLAE